MKLVLSLNSKKFIYDYVDIGVEYFVVGAKYFSCRQALSLEYDEIANLKKVLGNKKVWVLVNALVEEKYIDFLEKHLIRLSHIGVDGILFQDFGVLQIVKNKGYHFDMMYAPETLNTNAMTLNVLNQEGVTSAQLARVIPLEEQLSIHQQVHMPLMLQVHGVEYIAASKRALLTNYQEASGLAFDHKGQTRLTIQPRNSDYVFHIYENERGTHIFQRQDYIC